MGGNMTPLSRARRGAGRPRAEGRADQRLTTGHQHVKRARHSRVVDEHIQLALLAQELLSCLLHARQASEVELEEDDLALALRLGLERADGRIRLVLGPRGEVHLGILEKQLLDCLLANARVGARDQEDLGWRVISSARRGRRRKRMWGSPCPRGQEAPSQGRRWSWAGTQCR